WSVDHLFLDQDAVRTLVEVKRGSDTRIRREVGPCVATAQKTTLRRPVFWTEPRLLAILTVDASAFSGSSRFGSTFGWWLTGSRQPIASARPPSPRHIGRGCPCGRSLRRCARARLESTSCCTRLPRIWLNGRAATAIQEADAAHSGRRGP